MYRLLRRVEVKNERVGPNGVCDLQYLLGFDPLVQLNGAEIGDEQYVGRLFADLEG